MQTIKLFYLRDCPFCKKALGYIDDLRRGHEELRDIEIEMIEESEHPDVADRYDYHYVPAFFVGSRKVHEGGIYPDEVEQVLREALVDEC